MRNKYDTTFDADIRKYCKYHTKDQLLDYIQIKYDMKLSKHAIECYLNRRHIHCKDYNKFRVHPGTCLPIGTEYTKPDGMILIKTSKNIWEYKQRYIYEQYHNITLPTSTMVIFLDGDKTNFDINNLMAVEPKEYNFCRNKDLLSKNSEVTKTSMLTARLHYKAQERGDKNHG